VVAGGGRPLWSPSGQESPDGVVGVSTWAAAGGDFVVALGCDQQLTEMDERLTTIEEMLLEEYVEPQPQYLRRLRPVRTGVVGLRR
jgi:hypothetical protein